MKSCIFSVDKEKIKVFKHPKKENLIIMTNIPVFYHRVVDFDKFNPDDPVEKNAYVIKFLFPKDKLETIVSIMKKSSIVKDSDGKVDFDLYDKNSQIKYLKPDNDDPESFMSKMYNSFYKEFYRGSARQNFEDGFKLYDFHNKPLWTYDKENKKRVFRTDFDFSEIKQYDKTTRYLTVLYANLAINIGINNKQGAKKLALLRISELMLVDTFKVYIDPKDEDDNHTSSFTDVVENINTTKSNIYKQEEESDSESSFSDMNIEESTVQPSDDEEVDVDLDFKM